MLGCFVVRWRNQGGWRRPPRVPHLLVPRKIRYAALRVPPSEWLSMPDVGDDPVARCKRSAPAKHSVRSADGGTEV